MSQEKKRVRTDFTTSTDLCTNSDHGGYMGFHKSNCPYCTPLTSDDYNYDDETTIQTSSFESPSFGKNKLI